MLRALRWFIGGCGALALGLVLLAGGERVVWRDRVLPGVELAGVSVGGQSLDAVRHTIRREAAAREREPLDAGAGSVTFTFTPAEVGLDLDEAAAVAGVRRAGRDGHPLGQVLGVIIRRFRPVEVAWGATYDDARLADAVDRWAEQIDTRPADGMLRIEQGFARTEPARSGRTLVRPATRELVGRALLGREAPPLRLPVTVEPPDIDDEDTRQAKATAERVLAGPATVVVEGRAVTLSPTRLGALLTVTPAEGRLVVDLPPAALHEALAPALEGLEVAPRDARFVVETQPPPGGEAAPPGEEPAPAEEPGVAIRIEESAPGRALDAAPVARALLAGQRRVEGFLVEAAPTVDTERAHALRVVEPVSSFTTRFPAGQPRVRNIHRIADLLQDRLILPGERFSLNEAVGRRTAANGFVRAPVIYEGRFTEDIGGGVSQFATTFFNAAFFGGYRIAAHKAHTYYISRYPIGREATISFPEPDLVIENDSTSGILVRTSYTASSVTVTLFGDREGRSVRAEGPRVGRRSAGGYSVEVVRVIERPGQEPQRERFSTYYRTQPRQSRPAPAPARRPAPPPPPEESAAPG